MYKYFGGIFVVIASLFTLFGCGAQDLTIPEYPLSPEAVMTALQEAELSWEIKETETFPNGQVAYTLHAKNDKLAAFITSFLQGEKRILDISCMPYDANSSIIYPVAEEEWEKVIIAATLLYGEFENKWQVYDFFINDFDVKNTTSTPNELFVDGKLVNKITYNWESVIKNVNCHIRIVQPYRGMPQKYITTIRITGNEGVQIG